MAYGDPVIIPLQIAYERGWVGQMSNDWTTAMEAANKYYGNTQMAMAEIARLQSQGNSIQAVNASMQAQLADRQSADAKNMIASGMAWADVQDVISGKWRIMETNVGKVLVQTKQLEQEMPRFQVAADGALIPIRRGFENAFRSGMQFFGITIFGFGLRSLLKEMEASLGEKLPTAAQAAMDSFQTFAATAGSFAMMGMPQIGIVLGAVEAAIPLFLMLPPEIQETNKALDQMAKKDDLTRTLAQVLGISENIVKAMEDIAKKSPEAGAALRNAFDAARPMGMPEHIARNINWGDFLKSGLYSTPAGAGLLASMNMAGGSGAGDMLSGLSGSLTADQDRARLLSQRSALVEFASLGQAGLDSRRGADQADNSNKMLDAERAWYAARRDLQNKFNKDMLDADNNATAQRTQISDQAFEQRKEMTYRFNRQNEITWREYYDKLADLEFSYNQGLERLDFDKRKRDQQYAHDRSKIDESMYNSLADLAFKTAMELRKAKTEQEIEGIELEYAYGKAKIIRDASDKKDELSYRKQQAQEAADFQKHLDDDNYLHRRNLAARERDQKLNDTLESFNHDMDMNYKKERESIDLVNKRLDKEKELLKERYDEEMARSDKAKAKIMKDYDDAETKIKAKYQAEQDAIDAVRKKIDELTKKLEEPQTMTIQMKLSAVWDAAVSGFGADMNDLSSSFFKWLNEQGKNIFGFAPGGIIPGARGSPQWILAHGQERIQRPDQADAQMKEGSDQLVMINTDPLSGYVLRQILPQITSARAFREGVRVVLNDSHTG